MVNSNGQIVATVGRRPWLDGDRREVTAGNREAVVAGKRLWRTKETMVGGGQAVVSITGCMMASTRGIAASQVQAAMADRAREKVEKMAGVARQWCGNTVAVGARPGRRNREALVAQNQGCPWKRPLDRTASSQ